MGVDYELNFEINSKEKKVAKLRDEKLDFWIQNNLNVLLVGHKGVGKSSRVLDAFKKHGLKYKYFSAPTMDPWVDFLGVPKEQQDENGPFLELVKPKEFRDDNIEVIFMDEFNRAHKKVKNALMELIQFKSINGKQFKNLRMVWAAINPSDEGTYDVEEMDEAQEDRFQVQFHLDYEPDKEWFVEKFGEKVGKAAVEWWHDLPEPMKEKISPRRLEYAMNMNSLAGGDLRDVLPKECNINKLVTTIRTGPISETLKKMFEAKDELEAKKFLAIENNYAASIKSLLSPHELKANKKEWFNFYLPCLPAEKLSSVFATEVPIQDFMITNYEIYSDLINEIIEANKNTRLVKKIKRLVGDSALVISILSPTNDDNYTKPKHGSLPIKDWSKQLLVYETCPTETTIQRLNVFEEIVDHIPEKLSLKEALDTIHLINNTIGKCWPQTIRDIKPLMGVLNHCLQQVDENKEKPWKDTLKDHYYKIRVIIEKVVKLQWKKKLYRPKLPATV